MKKNIQTILLIAPITVALVGCNLSSTTQVPTYTKTITTTTVTTTVITTNSLYVAPSNNGSSTALSSPLYLITQQPETQCIQAGAFTAFSVRVSPQTNVVYQWRFGDADIPNATNREFFIQPVSVANVGKYTVQVTWPSASTSIVSSDAFLSVYSLWGTNSTGGSLTTSVQQFRSSTDTAFCSSSTVACNAYYSPLDETTSLYYFFYGPGVPLSSQSGPFINYGHNANLTITTIVTPDNLVPGGTVVVPSGVRLIRGFGSSPFDVDCAIGQYGAGLSFTGMATSTNPDLAKYRVTVYYHTPAPSSGNLTLKWSYSDGSVDY